MASLIDMSTTSPTSRPPTSDAPEPLPFQAVGGLQWFALETFSPHEIETGARRAAPLLDAFIDAELERVGLSDDALALVGFSQGTIMALHVGLRRRNEMAGIVGFSGALAAPDKLNEEIKSRPPVLLIHGTHDEVVPAGATVQAEQALEAAGVTVATQLRPRLGHGIDEQGATHAAAFLKAAFKTAAEGAEQPK